MTKAEYRARYRRRHPRKALRLFLAAQAMYCWHTSHGKGCKAHAAAIERRLARRTAA